MRKVKIHTVQYTKLHVVYYIKCCWQVFPSRNWNNIRWPEVIVLKYRPAGRKGRAGEELFGRTADRILSFSTSTHELLAIYVRYINPNSHGRGRICPPLFQRPITQKVLKCKKSVKNIYSTENFCWIFFLGYVPLKKGQFMPVLCLRTGQSLKKRY
jgi:hypothetical protein